MHCKPFLRLIFDDLFSKHAKFQLFSMTFLDFEKPLETLYQQLDKVMQIGEQGDVDITPMREELERKIKDKIKEIYSNLSGWDKVQLSRHPERPYTLYYIETMCDNFIELHGDRTFADDKAIVGGIAQLAGRTVVILGHQKGSNTKMRQYRNFGMANPEGYRKALRLMKLAERFGYPVICLVDTPGANPGIEAEERGQAEAIARNLFEMAQLKTPLVAVVIGEGASGGAIGIALGDRVFMLENTWYSVISPESCSSILWHTWEYKERAAEVLKLTAENMYSFGLIDGIIPEPLAGAQTAPEETAHTLKMWLIKSLDELVLLPTEVLVNERVKKYERMGTYDVLTQEALKEKETKPKKK